MGGGVGREGEGGRAPGPARVAAVAAVAPLIPHSLPTPQHTHVHTHTHTHIHVREGASEGESSAGIEPAFSTS